MSDIGSKIKIAVRIISFILAVLARPTLTIASAEGVIHHRFAHLQFIVMVG